MKNLKMFLVLIITTCLLVSNVYAKDVSLQWDTNETADYYIVYWGEVSGEYSGNSGNIEATTYDTGDLDVKYKYFAVKAFNACGNSSDFSDEVVYCPEEQKVQNFKIKVNVEVTVNVN